MSPDMVMKATTYSPILLCTTDAGGTHFFALLGMTDAVTMNISNIASPLDENPIPAKQVMQITNCTHNLGDNNQKQAMIMSTQCDITMATSTHMTPCTHMTMNPK